MIYTISNKSNQLEWGLEGDDRIVQNVLNIIRTKKFEVPFMHNLGVDPEIIEHKLPYIESSIVDDLRETIEEFEPRAKLIDVKILKLDENGNIDFNVKVEV